MAQGIIRIFVLFVIGAIIYDVLTHPKGTKAAIGGVSQLLGVGLSAASGRNIRG